LGIYIGKGLFGGINLGGLSGRSSLGHDRTTGLSLFGVSLGDEFLVFGGFFLVSKDRAQLFGLFTSFALQGKGGYESLDLGGLVAGLSLLGGKGTSDNVLADIIILREVEQFTDVVGTLGTKTTGDGVVGEALDGAGTDLGDDQVQDSNVLSNDAPSDGLAFALTDTSWSVCLVSLFAQQADTGVGQNTLTHRETLFVVSSTDTEDVTVEFGAHDRSIDFLGHTAFIKALETLFIIDFDDFLHPSAGASNIDLRNYINHRTIRYVDCFGSCFDDCLVKGRDERVQDEGKRRYEEIVHIELSIISTTIQTTSSLNCSWAKQRF